MSNPAKFTIERDYRIVDNEMGTTLVVGPDCDGAGGIELYTRRNDEHSEGYYGKVSLVLEPKLAIAVGEALIQAGKDAIERDKK